MLFNLKKGGIFKMVNENVQILVGGVAVSSANKLPVEATIETVSNEAIGAIDDAAVTDPALEGSTIALMKGLLTAINTLNTAIGTLNTNIGAKADAAVTDPAVAGSLIALTKGVLTEVTPAG